jgi:phage major head subunit gpT-like protein
MAVINTGLLTKGLRSEFFTRFEATAQHYKDLATRVESTTDSEKYAFLGTVPQMREWAGGRLAKGLRAESYNIENLKYEATIEVDRDEIDDDQTGQIRIRVGELALRAATHKDYLIAQLLSNGEGADFKSYDGLPFISESHQSGGSGVQSNLLSADAVAPDEPTTAEFKLALKAAIAKMMGFKDDQGEPMMLLADGLVCVVPPTMFFTASEVVSAAIIGDTTNILKNIARVISFPWLTDLSKWYLLGLAGVVRPFIFQDRAPVEFGALEQDSDTGFRREVFLYGVRARYRIAYGYWQYAVRTDFAT